MTRGDMTINGCYLLGSRDASFKYDREHLMKKVKSAKT